MGPIQSFPNFNSCFRLNYKQHLELSEKSNTTLNEKIPNSKPWIIFIRRGSGRGPRVCKSTLKCGLTHCFTKIKLF